MMEGHIVPLNTKGLWPSRFCLSKDKVDELAARAQGRVALFGRRQEPYQSAIIVDSRTQTDIS